MMKFVRFYFICLSKKKKKSVPKKHHKNPWGWGELYANYISIWAKTAER